MSSQSVIEVKGACPHDCPDTCAVITEVQDGKAVGFRGDPDHPITNGWLCAKVRPYLDRVYHPDRLLYPLRRVGPKGSDQWERISWDEAVAEISDRWRDIIDEYGAPAILPYSYSGTLGLIQLAVSNERFWRRLGASGLQRSICGAAAETAVQMTLGGRFAPDASQLLDSKFILIWGHNPASTSPHLVPFIRKAQRQGAEVVVIDPRRTRSARSADQHIQPNPATDGALALGLMHVIFRDNLHDEAWLNANTIGWRELQTRAESYPPERVSEITGLSSDLIEDLARRYATRIPSIIKFSDGIQRHANGGQTSRALCCLPALIGQYGVRGGGLFYSTSDWVAWDDEAVSHASESPPVPRMVNMNRIGAALTGEVQDPPIKSLFVFCANPVASSPNAALTIEGLMRDDLFTVVHELFMTDTAKYADIVLPAATQLEQVDIHRAYGHRNLQYNSRAIEPRGESRSNWDLMRTLAKAMGFTEPWLHAEPEDVFAEIFKASQSGNPTLEGIDLERFERDGTVPLTFGESNNVPFGDLHFPTPSGKVEIQCEAVIPEGMDPIPNYVPPAEFERADPDSLVMITGAAHHYVSSSMANLPTLMSKEGAPAVEINPEDAIKRSINTGDPVKVFNSRGWCQLAAHVTDDVPPGVVISPKGHWAQNAPGGRNVNWTTSDAIADLAGQSTFHSNVVWIEPMPAAED